MDQSNEVVYLSVSRVFLEQGYSSRGIIMSLTQQGLSNEEAWRILDEANDGLRRDLEKDNIFQVGAPGSSLSRLLCSDNNCPCPGTETLIPGETGYLYISQEVVNNRQNAITARDLDIKGLPEQTNLTVPILMCRIGAEKRNLDLNIAGQDAELWYKSGRAPLRTTPKR